MSEEQKVCVRRSCEVMRAVAKEIGDVADRLFTVAGLSPGVMRLREAMHCLRGEADRLWKSVTGEETR